MKITINARVLNERRGGPHRYTYNIIKELAGLDKKNIYYIILQKKIEFDFKLPDNFKIIIFSTKYKLLFDYFYLPLFSYKNKIDIFIFPKNTFSPMIKGKKIPVYHDIVYFEKLNFREFKFFDNLHHKIMIPICAKFSAIDLAVSDFTASRMKKLLKIHDDKIYIIKEGVEKSFKKIRDKKSLKEVAAKFNIKTPFFFYSGSLSPRKNMVNVIKAFYKIKDNINHNIYFTGGDSWRDNEIFELILNLNLNERVIKLGFLEEHELIALYNLADCYLYPSLYEGFGLPILEAQACGCPVITSNISSCPEVAGDGALFVDPYNVDDIADAMLKIINDKKLKQDLIQKGAGNHKKYSWKKAGIELIKLLNVISKKK